ncbi:hypothetical protein C368_03682 [Cryptococcus neoformans 125.91]|nr:hypothetical protein C368_03682 [Cryptococcus neoformans var. grubii 125.91]
MRFEKAFKESHWCMHRFA